MKWVFRFYAIQALGGVGLTAATGVSASFHQAHRQQDRSVDADAHGGIARFRPLQGGEGGESAIRYHRHRQSASAADG